MARILIVDDEPALLTLLQYRMDKLGHAVVAATTGAEAVERFQTEKPD
ncbi:MAG: DNA-binding response regulator, partial [Armatimonadetes bacterium]|nr:DNA-binding response regulator [Armatimonadota bacterium]